MIYIWDDSEINETLISTLLVNITNHSIANLSILKFLLRYLSATKGSSSAKHYSEKLRDNIDKREGWTEGSRVFRGNNCYRKGN